jgi:hypothetical protein
MKSENHEGNFRKALGLILAYLPTNGLMRNLSGLGKIWVTDILPTQICHYPSHEFSMDWQGVINISMSLIQM